MARRVAKVAKKGGNVRRALRKAKAAVRAVKRA